MVWRNSEWLPGFGGSDDRAELLNVLLRELRVAPGAPPECQAWDEIRNGPFSLSLDEIESEVTQAHRAYRVRCPTYPDVVAEQLVHALEIPLVFDRTADGSKFNPDTGLMTIIPRSDRYWQYFEIVHETAESLFAKKDGSHPDVQVAACGLVLERKRALHLLRRYGLRGALSRVRRTHRRAPPWMLAVRLAMVLVASPEA